MTLERVTLGAALRRAWVGYQQRLDEAMATAGFGDRRFPDGRVLRMCSAPPEMTIADIGRELGITRQGAAKIVADLHDRGYLSVTVSETNRREKVVTATPRAIDYLAAQRRAVRAIERRLRAEVGEAGFQSLYQLLDALAGDDDLRMRDYLRTMGRGDL